MNGLKIQWHPGFVAAMNLELAENRDDLIYEKEYNLNTKPLEIDLLVIKKDKDVQITNEIGKMFRGHNILEYRSPEDHLDIGSFYKAGAYASLYKAYGETVDGRKAEDITVSLVREGKPEGLFRYFKEYKWEVLNPYPGIYYVMGGVLFPTQVIVTGELDGKNHGWLKSLSGKLKKQEMEALLKRARSLSGKLDRELADAVLEVSVKANREIVEELKGDEAMCQALLEIMEPEISQIVREATEEVTKKMEREKEEAAKKEAEETAIKMIKMKRLTVEEIQECIPKLTVQDIERLANNLA